MLHRETKLMALQQQLSELIAPTIEKMGYQFIGLRYLPQGKFALLRVYIDTKPKDETDGVTLDDCTKVSHQISGILDVEDLISGQYNLEISSPGLDRPLFVIDHYQQFIGREAIIKFTTMINGKRKLTGKIIKVINETIYLSSKEASFEVSIKQIDNAQLVPIINWNQK